MNLPPNAATIPENATYAPTSVIEVQDIVQKATRVLPHGARTKAPLLATSTAQATTHVEMTGLAGIVEYDPGEYTFTAYAGTRLADIATTLAEHGQYMPFDPPLVSAGATLGGTIAAGLSGSGRYRYGGLRDFILGVHLVDGQGRLLRGGGKVVKNAAGFDIPKLMVGSMGRLGIVISASFKVFPAPRATATLIATLPSLSDALSALARLMAGPYDLEALDLLPQRDRTVQLLARIGGPADVLGARLERLRTLIGTGQEMMEDHDLWIEASEFSWAGTGNLLVKTATTPPTLARLDAALSASNILRSYCVGGNLAWIAWPDSAADCHHFLLKEGRQGLVVQGDAPQALIGAPLQNPFLERVRTALDPHRRFLDFE
jgi:glycolate oxidase FAD binding subunit